MRLRHSELQLRLWTFEAKRLCHSRARSCGEPRRTAETVYGCDQDSNVAPSQVSGAFAAEDPKLPKLMAPTALWSAARPGCGAGAPVPAWQQTTGHSVTEKKTSSRSVANTETRARLTLLYRHAGLNEPCQQ